MKIHVILGPTGVGKTARSIALARHTGAPVVSLDRFQMFQDLEMGTGRPANAELDGTERIYLSDHRTVDDGELPADEAFGTLMQLLTARRQDVILEGGSLSLCRLFFERGPLAHCLHEIEYLPPPDPAVYAQYVRRWVCAMLAPTDGRRSLSEELAAVWNNPARLAFVETIAGYGALARYCRGTDVHPRALAGRAPESAVEAVLASHIEYAQQQCQLFEWLLEKHRAQLSGGSSQQQSSSGWPQSSAELDLRSPAALEDPYALYAQLRRKAPVCYSSVLDAWVVSRYDDVVAVLKAPESFSSAGVLKVKAEPPPEVSAVLSKGIPYVRTLIDNDPPDHTRFRNLVNKVFIPQQVHAMQSHVLATADALIDDFAHAGGADLMEHFAFPLPMYVIAGILGLPRADVRDLKRWCDDWMALQSGTAPVEHLVECARNYLRMQQYFLEKVDERTRAPKEDLLSMLIQARVEGEAPLHPNELVRLLMSLLVAGHETTTHSIGNTLVQLFRNPPQLQLLREDLSLAAQAFEEGLRIDPPVQSLFRKATANVWLGGVQIPCGARVMVLYGSANRDEMHFADPDRFDVQRPAAAKTLSFSRGVHFCLGASLARLEGRIALERLVRRLKNLRLDCSHRLERVQHFFLRGYKRLPATWDFAVKE